MPVGSCTLFNVNIYTFRTFYVNAHSVWTQPVCSQCTLVLSFVHIDLSGYYFFICVRFCTVANKLITKLDKRLAKRDTTSNFRRKSRLPGLSSKIAVPDGAPSWAVKQPESSTSSSSSSSDTTSEDEIPTS